MMIEVQVIGDPWIAIGPKTIGPSARTQFALALYVLLERRTQLRRARLAELLWPHEEPATRSHSLRQAIYELRQIGLPLKGRDLVRLEADVRVDLELLEDTESPEALMAAMRGEVLRGIRGPGESYDDWLEQTRSLGNARVRHVLVSRLLRLRQNEETLETEHVAQVLRRVDPLNEDAIYCLAEIMAARGDKAEALSLIDQYTADLGAPRRDITIPVRQLRDRVS